VSEPKRIDEVAQLEPLLGLAAEELEARSARLGVRIKIIETYRSDERQRWLYAKGRTSPGPKVTAAGPGRSWHNHRRAFDIVVLDAAGRADWSNTAAYNLVGKLGRELGLEWGGNFPGLADLGHFQLCTISLEEAIDLDFARQVVDLVHAYLDKQQGAP
jgi:peptidoglycan L-alanyl-D-glutamate endopeptidase CwlK